MSDVATFLSTCALVIVTPGQDTALTIRDTLLGGRSGDIPLARERSRRVRFSEVQTSTNRRDAARRDALTDLARMGQEIEHLLVG